MVDDLVIKLKKLGKADGTVNRYLSHLKTFLTWAKSRKYRTAPVKGEDGVAFSWQNESVGRIRWITAEEEKALGEYFLSRKNPEAEAVWDLVQVAIETGCRRDELLTAELEQVTFSGRPRLHLWETKTDTPRTVPMREATAKKLRKLIKEGRMPGRRNLRSWWERAREHMGLTGDADFVFHACRHTCATRMVDADINVFVIKEWMGHKVIETTLRYAHVKPKNLEDALEKVGDYHSAQEQKAQKTAENDVPHNAPTSEGNGDLAIAA
jgi:integrase